MNREVAQPITAFYLTGQRSGDDHDDVRRMGLRPALFSAYQDLSRLRYDYPVVLIDNPPDAIFIRSLSDIVDQIIGEPAAAGVDDGRRRKHLVRVEAEIRGLSATGAKGSLLQLWDRARNGLVAIAEGEARKTLAENLDAARRTLQINGGVVDCDAELPLKVMTHMWQAVHKARAERVGEEICDLIIKLSNVLKTDELASGAAHTADSLRSSVGVAFEATFDFQALSDILAKPTAHACLPQTRRRRILAVLSALSAQRFFNVPSTPKRKNRRHLHPYCFESCGRALKAFREHLPEMVELVKAMATARLEIDNAYNETTHDPFFEGFGENSLGSGDLAVFPPYLVTLDKGLESSAEKAKFTEIITSGLPIKVLLRHRDILDDLPIEAGRLAFGVKGQEHAGAALGLDGVYIVQSSSAYIYRLRDAILKGLIYDGPALFSVFAGADDDAAAEQGGTAVPPYLKTAAAIDSRAFPSFVRDPASGGDWSTRFSLPGNPQSGADWPVHRLAYEDRELQRQSIDLAFTFADFVACDARYAGHFVGVAREDWHDGMIPLADFIDLEPDDAEGRFPYILMVDDNDLLHRAVVDDRLVEAARRCRNRWRSLQELGGINNSHVNSRVAKMLAEEKVPPAPAPAPAPAPEIVKTREHEPPEVPVGLQAEPVEPETPDTGEPFIETLRCTTCNECTGINNKMFVYNDNQQAVIADPGLGTYRQLVEAAESCQVAIIHPGAPKNPNEPGLDDLMVRAEAFL